MNIAGLVMLYGFFNESYAGLVEEKETVPGNKIFGLKYW